jgi:tetratricopeptide (TPR) repeat protein
VWCGDEASPRAPLDAVSEVALGSLATAVVSASAWEAGSRAALGGMVAAMMSGLDAQYDLGEGHPLLGCRLPDLDRADAILGEALAILRGFGDTYASAHVLSHRAVVPLKRGDHRLACRYAEEALALTRQTGDRLATCVSFLVLGQAAQSAGEQEEAARYFTDALTLSAEIVDRASSAYSLLGLANVAMARGQMKRAAGLLGAAEVLLELAGSPRYAFMPPHPLRDRAADVVREQVGERAWAVAWRQGRAMMLDEVVEFALSSGKSGVLT